MWPSRYRGLKELTPVMISADQRRRRLAAFLRLYGEGLSFAEIGRRLRVARRTVQRWARRRGWPAQPDHYGPDWRRRCQRAVRAAAQRRECDSLSEWVRQRRQQRYRAAGYPPGVGCRGEARAVDLARRLGGLTATDLPPAGLTPGWARNVIRRLVGVGVLVPLGKAASNVRTKRPVCVWRLDFRAEGSR